MTVKTLPRSLPSLLLLLFTACSHAPAPHEADPVAHVGNHTISEADELSFVERVIAQVPVVLGEELMLSLYRGLAPEGRNLMLSSGRLAVGASERLTASQLAKRLGSEANVTQFVQNFRNAHPNYFDESANATIDRAVAHEAKLERSMHADSNHTSGMSMQNEELVATIQNMAHINKQAALDAVQIHNLTEVDVVDAGTCTTSEKLSPVALRHEGEMLHAMRTSVNHLEVQSIACARIVLAGAAIRFINDVLKSPSPYLTFEQLKLCHIPKPNLISLAELRALEARYPDAKMLPENGEGLCRN